MEPVFKNLGKVRPTVDNNNWSINNEYDLLTIVYDPSSNKSYISRQPVPANVVIDNREYWLPFGVGKFVDNAIININYLDGVSEELVTYTLEEAIARIGDEDKRLGVIISFYGNESNDSHTPGWCLYQFMSSDLNDWDNVDAWDSIYYNRNKNVGWFRTESDLLSIYPNPHKGDYCYIGTSLLGSFVYRCYENGTWVNTNELASANIGIIIDGTITISQNGTWVVDGEDTGIKAVGTGIDRITYTASSADGGTNILQIKLTDGTQFSFPIKNGNQGNSGYQGVAGELEVVNNLTDGGATKALSAEMGKQLKSLIDEGYSWVGVADLNTVAGSFNGKVFYIATTPGTYDISFGSIVLANDEVAFLKYNGSWSKQTINFATKTQVDQLGHDVNGKINCVALFDGLSIIPEEIIGYLSSEGEQIRNTSFHSYISGKIPVKEGDKFNISLNGNAVAPSVFLYNNETLITIAYSVTNITISANITHVLFASYSSIDTIPIFFVKQTYPISQKDKLNSLNDRTTTIENKYQEKRLITEEIELTPTINKAAGLFDWLINAIDFADNPEYKYSKFDVSDINYIHVIGRAYSVVNGYALIAFVDENNTVISHLEDSVNEIIMAVPTNAKYAYVNGIVYNDIKGFNVLYSYESLIPEIDEIKSDIIDINDSLKGNQKERQTSLKIKLNEEALNGLYDWAAGTIFNPEAHPEYRHIKISNNNYEDIIVSGRSFAVEHGYALVAFVDENGGNLGHLEISVNAAEIRVPNNCAFIYINGTTSDIPQCFIIEHFYSSLDSEIDKLNLNLGIEIFTNEVVGYLTIDGLVPDTNFRSLITTKIPVIEGEKYSYIGNSNSLAIGIILYNVDTIVSTLHGNQIITIPNGITHIMFASFANISQGNIPSIEIKKLKSILNDNIDILCYGDSVTEGMSMPRGDDYPGQLATMFDAANYNVNVKNRGNSGEDAPSIISRTGGIGIYFKETVQLPQDTSWVQINVNWNNLAVALESLSSEDYNINYTLAKEDISEVFIDGNWYDLKVENQNWSIFTTYIKKKSIDNTASSIPANAILIPKIDKQPKLYILFAGYNGRTSLNYEKWEYLMKCGLNQSDGNGIIIGSQIAIWVTWNDIAGTTNAEKYQSYRRKALASFGNKFVDLYDLFFSHALDYALDGGFFTDKTQEELDAIQAKLDEHIVPAEFSYDNEHEGNVHLNKAGYYVVAKLVYDRIIAINLLNV